MLERLLSHPIWTGIGGIIAILALITSFLLSTKKETIERVIYTNETLSSPKTIPHNLVSKEDIIPQGYRFTDAEISAYESEVTLVEQLIKDGDKLISNSEVSSYYSRVKAWEGNCINFLNDFDKHHENATDFSFRFQYWRTQDRGSNIAQLSGEIIDILIKNLGTLNDVRAHAIKVVSEVKTLRK